MSHSFAKLRQKLAQIGDLQGAMNLLVWDRETMMPDSQRTAETRADQVATLGGVIHRMRTAEDVGEMLAELNESDEYDYDSLEAGIIRKNWYEYQKMVRIPTEQYMAFLAASQMATHAWKEARAKADFSIFQPHLEKLVTLQKDLAERMKDDDQTAYDALLDFYEQGMTADAVKEVFEPLKPRLKKLISAIADNADAVDDSMMRRQFDTDMQIEMGRLVAEALGFDFSRGRLDLSTHPFTGGANYADVRMTTRATVDFFPESITSTMHETGHAIHAQRMNKKLYRSGAELPGLSTAESQSRFYENHIGRSRQFWQHYLPFFKKTFPAALDGVLLDDFYAAINKVEPSFIRVDADEVTYGMHIMLRFELEEAIISGELEVKDLPEAWNERMQTYLGITPPNDAKGVLQDIHWSQSPMGYFPDYLLGSIFSAQLWYKLLEERPSTLDEISAGQFTEITNWLTEKVQVHGGLYTFAEMVERATGEALSADPYMTYLTEKYSAIYGL